MQVIFEIIGIVTLLISLLSPSLNILAQGGTPEEVLERFITKNNLSPLDKTILNQDYELVKHIISVGEPVNPPDTSKGFPLLFAVITDNVFITELLLQKGANINTSMNGDVTALSMAVNWNLIDMTNLLIKHKADVHKTIKGISLLDLADQFGHYKIAQILEEAGVKRKLPLKAEDLPQTKVQNKGQSKGTNKEIKSATAPTPPKK